MKPTLRITGGIYGGRRVKCPPGEIRPAMDRMRESLFAVLGDLTGSSFLDLFAGSGIVGLEAASRGAAEVVCVERDRKKREVTEANLAVAEGRAELRIMPAATYIGSCRRVFDYVYLDPPFRFRDKERLLARLSASACVAAGSVVMIHHPGDVASEAIGTMTRFDSRRYGGSYVCLYRCGNERAS